MYLCFWSFLICWCIHCNLTHHCWAPQFSHNRTIFHKEHLYIQNNPVAFVYCPILPSIWCVYTFWYILPALHLVVSIYASNESKDAIEKMRAWRMCTKYVKLGYLICLRVSFHHHKLLHISFNVSIYFLRYNRELILWNRMCRLKLISSHQVE